MFKREGAVTREVREWVISVPRLGLKDLKRDGVKGVQLKLKATADEPKKVAEAKNGSFEVEIFEKWSTRKAPTEED